jgi:2-polyprenyl-6-methoxyphenol hydroxylase-like FAD-dependent oxidoreductase
MRHGGRRAAAAGRAYDVVVVGARCAGAATAMLLARHGLRVLVVDRGRPGTDTLSTHALMWGGVLQLARWGVLPALDAAGTPVVRATSFHYGEETLRIPLAPRDGAPGLYAPRRYLLDAVLADAAAAAGAELLYGARVLELLVTRKGRVRGVLLEDAAGARRRVQAGLVVGADGLRSTVAGLVGAEAYRVGRHSSGVVYGYFAGLGEDGYHWHYSRARSSVGVIPTNGGLSCVFAAVSSRRFRDEIARDARAGLRSILAECAPPLGDKIARLEPAERLRGFAGELGFVRRSVGPGWALVGDAAYFKDPITAHGITDALRDAELLARAVASGSESALFAYPEARDAMALGLFEVTDEIASYEWDLAAVQRMHVVLSQEMKAEVREMGTLWGGPAAPPLDPRPSPLAGPSA